MYIFFALVFVFCLVMFFVTSNNKRKQEEYFRRENISARSEFLIHATGLPIPEGIYCTVTSYPDRINIKADNFDVNLDKSKLVNVCIKSETDIQKYYVSSAGGAIAGAMTFGALGALVGGRAKEKSSKVVKKYLIFTYQKSDELQYFSFDCTKALNCQAFVSEFNKSAKGQEQIHIDL